MGLLDKLLTATGTKIAFVNRANLEFALDGVKTKFGYESSYDIMAKKAVYLIFQIVNGHPLADGNKRTVHSQV